MFFARNLITKIYTSKMLRNFEVLEELLFIGRDLIFILMDLVSKSNLINSCCLCFDTKLNSLW